MKRVSSRPRLHIDTKYESLNLYEEDDDISNANFYDDVKMNYKANNLLTICDEDALSHILQFLTPSEIRSVQAINLKFHSLCRKGFVWEEHLKRAWPMVWMYLQRNNSHEEFPMSFSEQLSDDYHIPSPCSSSYSNSVSMEKELKEINYSLLHGIQAKTHPKCLNKTMLSSPEYARCFQCLPDAIRNGNDYSDVIVFKGEVGQGDRSLLADEAFPSFPLFASFENVALSHYHPSSFSSISSRLLNAFSRSSSSRMKKPKYPIAQSPFGGNCMRPFVAPYACHATMSKDNRKVISNLKVNVTPRLVAYYEVTLFEKPEAMNEELSSSTSNPFTRDLNPNRPDDCVAIGIATSKFLHTKKMPGWDEHSFGYHSDDGGIFHAQGDMVRRYGPKFNAGDTVGCGINYANRGIFFTHNGEFLGYAWLGVDIEVSYYASIGVDSNLPFSVNFGMKPFTFDLTSFHEQYSDEVNSILQIKTGEGVMLSSRSRSKGERRNNALMFHHGPGKRLS